MPSVQEIIGQLFLDFSSLRGEYAKLLNLVEQIKSGQIDRDNVDINSLAQSWSVRPPAPVAVEPDED
jgi:hypothetical protein